MDIYALKLSIQNSVSFAAINNQHDIFLQVLTKFESLYCSMEKYNGVEMNEVISADLQLSVSKSLC